MKVAITGASGFIGSLLVTKLSTAGDRVVVFTRNRLKTEKIFPASDYPNLTIVPYNPSQPGDWQQAISGCDGVINLAGEPIAERWTTAHKQEILNSRQLVTQNVVEAIKSADSRPKVLVNASAVGYYGTSETDTFTETSPPGDDFLAQVCQTWEGEAEKVKELGVRLAIIRIGIVLGEGGGALAKMIGPFQMFVGGPIGSGRQWLSWIHREDLVELFIYALKHELEGVLNGTAPNPVRMNQFSQTLGEVMHRPSWLPVPDFALELLLGDGAKVVLEGQQVIPENTEAAGFKYQYSTLKPALENIMAKS